MKRDNPSRRLDLGTPMIDKWGLPRKAVDRAMKRLLGIGLCLLVGGCGSPSTASSPSPIPLQVTGNYVLVVQASSTACQALSPNRYVWDVTATFQQITVGAVTGIFSVQIPLPSPQPSLQILLTYNSDPLNPAIAQGSLSTPIPQLGNGPGVPIPGSTLSFDTNATLAGTVTAAADGRGQITSGTLVGDFELLDPTHTIVQSCYAGDHQFTLTTR